MAIGDRKKIIIDTDPGIGIYLSPFHWIRFGSLFLYCHCPISLNLLGFRKFWVLLDSLHLVELLGFTESWFTKTLGN